MKILASLNTLRQSVLADYESTRRYRGKYHAQDLSSGRLAPALVTKIGLQMLLGVRAMQALKSARVPFAPKLVSRLLRHLYGAEIHWDADIAPGISLVHGNGLVIGKDATVGPGCILFHNVTLGQGIDALTRQIGGPTLEADVHVGPGATLLGPIRIGAGTKIMAGAVLTESVPPRSLVRSPVPQVVSRDD
jgi:serine O-acetyltransferase